MRDQRSSARVRRQLARRGTVLARSVVETLEERRLLASIAGATFEDNAGDGVRNGTDGVFPYRRVYLDSNDNGAFDTGERYSESAYSDGSYRFDNLTAGTYKVRVVVPPQYRQSAPVDAHTVTVAATDTVTGRDFALTTTVPTFASVAGNLFEDVDGNGVRGADDHSFYGEGRIYVDLNQNAAFDADEPYVFSDPFGSYKLRWYPGTYTIRAEFPATHTPSFPANGAYTVTFQTGLISFGKDFGAYGKGTVSGSVFDDLDGNGVRGPTDRGFDGRTVYADLNGNARFDADEPSAITGLSGGYSGFYNLKLNPGTYTVRQVLPEGWSQTAPANDGGIVVTVRSDLVNITRNFIVRTSATTGSVTATVFRDNDGDGKQNAGDAPLPGVTVYADLNQNFGFDAGEPSAVTDASGLARLTGLPAGLTRIRRVLPDAEWWTTVVGGDSKFVTVVAGDTVSAGAFAAGPKSTIGLVEGKVFQDANVNGTYQLGETTFDDRTVYDDANDNGVFDPGERTINSRFYVSDGSNGYSMYLPVGRHILRQVLPAGWTQTTPPVGVDVRPGVTETGVNHGSTNAAVGTGSIWGFLWDDVNANGAHDPSEPTVLGSVYLDLNDNGVRDAGDPTAFAGWGGYVFKNLAPGAYRVRLVETRGARHSFPGPASSSRATVTAGGDARLDVGQAYVPMVEAGGPYSLYEGTWGPLYGASASWYGSARVTTFEWDFDYDGTTFDVDATGVSPTLSAVGLDGPTTRTLAFRATNEYGVVSNIAVATFTVMNRPPTATLAGGGPVARGDAGSVTFSKPADASPADLAAGLRYSFDFNGDGTYDVLNSPSPTAVVPAAFLSTLGDHVIRGRVADKDGGATDYTTTITVVANPRVGAIQGVVFDDRDADGVRDAGEGPIASRWIFLDANGDGFVQNSEPSAFSGADGSYAFTDLAPGTYKVLQIPADSVYQTTPEVEDGSTVVVSAGGEARLDFGHNATGSIVSGYVYVDTDGNLIRTQGEPLLGGRTVYADLNNNNSFDAGEPSVVTKQRPDNYLGWHYRLRLPGPGTFTIRQIVPAGWEPTLPVTPSGWTVTIGADQLRTFSFASQPQTTPPPPPPPGGYTGTPFSGTPITLASTGTTTLQVENFDNGAEGVAYHDVDAANLGKNTYRATGVDLESINDGGAGVGLGFVKAGEWLKYTVDVPKAGAFNVGFRVASLKAGGKLHLEVDGVRVGGQLTVPDTAGWGNWRTVTLSGVQLPAGRHVIKLAFDAAGAIGYVGNINHLTFTPATVTPPPPPPPPPPGYAGKPFGGKAAVIAATGASTIQVENFDDGGQGVAYHDTDAANVGKNTYRATGVDLESINDGGAGVGLGYVKAGEWLKYTVDVAADGKFDLDFRLASLTGGGSFHLEIDGVRVMPNLTVPKSGAWTTYTTLKQPGVQLKAGRHVVTLKFDTNGSTGFVANFNWMRFTRV